MRVTNKMIMNNASSNINSAKEFVNIRNKQMTSQKKIDKPSDDPVIAVRSLRLSTTLAQVTQYYDKNIPDASQWLSVTETALMNMVKLGQDCREIAVSGATGSVNTQDDRKTMLKQLQSLQQQLYAEGNADYAQRTVFTGYRTNQNLVFTEDELKTKYRIDQSFNIEAHMEEHRYYSGNVEIPTTKDELLAPSLDPAKAISDTTETDYYRIRMNYNKTEMLNSIKITYGDGTVFDTITSNTDANGDFDNTLGFTHSNTTDGFEVTVFETENDWANNDPDKVKKVASNEMVYIKETGELIFGEKVAAALKENKATVDIQYDKTGFEKGQLRPEHYYNCTKLVDNTGATLTENNTYTKFDANGDVIHFDIEYTVAANQTITINTEASDVFDSSLQRDIDEMIDILQRVISASDKMDQLTDMKRETQYASDECQEWLDTWYKAAQKEFDFLNNSMQKLFDTELGKIDKYYAKMNLALTDLGCKKDSLDLTKTRVGDQQETVQDLQSKNDDIDLSQIIIDYTAAYTAYQASLTAAGKLGDSTLLNYI